MIWPILFVIGDRLTDVEMAKNLGCKAILINGDYKLLENALQKYCAIQTTSWDAVTIFCLPAEGVLSFSALQTDVFIELNIDGSGKTDVSTGLHFFDHMLEQIGKHSAVSLTIKVKGRSTQSTRHHTIEDTGLALGEACEAIGKQRGIERYGFTLPWTTTCVRLHSISAVVLADL